MRDLVMVRDTPITHPRSLQGAAQTNLGHSPSLATAGFDAFYAGVGFSLPPESGMGLKKEP